MLPEPNRHLTFQLERHGAYTAAASGSVVLLRVASRLRFSSAISSNVVAIGKRGRVARFRTVLRSSLRRRRRVASRGLVSVCIAAVRDSSQLRSAHLPRAALLPNNSLVPTLETRVRFVSVSSGAAQLKRYVSG